MGCCKQASYCCAQKKKVPGGIDGSINHGHNQRCSSACIRDPIGAAAVRSGKRAPEHPQCCNEPRPFGRFLCTSGKAALHSARTELMTSSLFMASTASALASTASPRLRHSARSSAPRCRQLSAAHARCSVISIGRSPDIHPERNPHTSPSRLCPPQLPDASRPQSSDKAEARSTEERPRWESFHGYKYH